MRAFPNCYFLTFTQQHGEKQMQGPVVYHNEPKFPASDQHPNARRYEIGGLWIDWTGDEVEAVGLLLERDRRDASAEIARLAEARRSAITAAAPGKLLAYLLKFELVLRANGTPPDEAAKARLTAEATARGITYDEHITNISANRFAQEDAWMRIETVEADSKAAVATASDRAAVDAVVNTAKQLFAKIGG